MAQVPEDRVDTSTDKIKFWRSSLTLVAFVLANITVLFPFHIPIPVPIVLYKTIVKSLVALRVIPPRTHYDRRKKELVETTEADSLTDDVVKPYLWFRFPINFVTGPLIADIFLLAIGAINGDEIKGGIVGSDHIVPYDILLFFFSLAYIAISIDASGLIRYLAFKVLQLGGKVGHRLFFFLYAFFFGLGSFIGNDPIILSGTAFLAYMTRVSSNIVHPRAWIHTQFAVANIASAILVSSNPTNLVLAGAFNIKFIYYTRDMVVPVVITAIVLFPFLLYIVFADESLIPSSIKMHELDEEARRRKPVNPNIPYGRGTAGEEEKQTEEGQMLSLEEIMNPFLDKTGAAFGACVMAATLITILVLNEVKSSQDQETAVFYVTLPAAVVMLIFDLAWGWIHREETRKIARAGRQEVAEAAERRRRELAAEGGMGEQTTDPAVTSAIALESLNTNSQPSADEKGWMKDSSEDVPDGEDRLAVMNPVPDGTQNDTPIRPAHGNDGNGPDGDEDIQHETAATDTTTGRKDGPVGLGIEIPASQRRADTQSTHGLEEEKNKAAEQNAIHECPIPACPPGSEPRTLVSVTRDTYRWSQDTFPTVMAVLSHLPFALLPFSFEMFILVQGLVTKGWVAVFAYGWKHWVDKTGTIGAIGGMGFLSVILCNFAGTNIGTTILLSRVIQAWEQIHIDSGEHLGDRRKWATIYSMALGVNYGAFSIAFSASLAGLLWRDILFRKHIRVHGLEFARVNLPIISIAMTIGLAVLTGEVYLFRHDD
ncbi:hypothetical protein GGS20DRAFT_577002 [Poronia punctata]|nr:hypothetical protein GGS20DRAFT_577002 [Poronia punctata]